MIKLKSLHIDNRIVNWIEDYLKNRVQRVQIRGEKSDWLNVFSGVPQGSVIGPILFLIYINDIQEGIESKISIFADDTKLRHRVGNEEEVSVLKRDLKRLEGWSDRNGMHFNVEKCSVMHCGFQNKKNNYEIYGNILRKTICEKDLGILVNPDMKFKDQVSAASKKVNKILGMINRNFDCMNKEMFQILYEMLA